MCLIAENRFDANELVALHEFPLFILDEIGLPNVYSSMLFNGAASCRKRFVLNHDLCEDG